jgi:hypothetical protein
LISNKSNAPSWGNFISTSFILSCALCCGYVNAKSINIKNTHLHQKAKIDQPKVPKKHVIHNCTVKDNKINMLSCALYHEARSEGLFGMWLVGNVILNRKAHKRYPTSVKNVIYQKNQFSYLARKSIKVYDKQAWEQAQIISKILVSPFIPQFKNTLCQVSFIKNNACKMNESVVFYFKTGTEPKWVSSEKGFVKTLSYKNHSFYEELK